MQREEKLLETVMFHGHPMITALHPTTIEVTKEERLSLRGDCIVGVGADKGCSDLAPETRRVLSDDCSVIVIRITSGKNEFRIRASGDSRLTFTDPRDIVIRKSSFVCGRTLAVRADRASVDMPPAMVRELKREGSVGKLEILVSRQ